MEGVDERRGEGVKLRTKRIVFVWGFAACDIFFLCLLAIIVTLDVCFVADRVHVSHRLVIVAGCNPVRFDSIK